MGVEKIHLQFWNAQTFLYLFYLTDYALKLILVGPILCFIKVTAFKTSWPYLWTYFWCFYSFGIRRASQTTLYKIALALRPLLMTLQIFLLTLSYQSYSINGASKGYSSKQQKKIISRLCMGVEKIHLQFWNAQTFLYLFYLTDYALKLILVGPILCFIKVKAFKTSWPYLWTYFWCFYSFGIRKASQTTLYKIALALRPLLMTLRIFLLTLSYQSYSINGASKGYSSKQQKK